MAAAGEGGASSAKAAAPAAAPKAAAAPAAAPKVAVIVWRGTLHTDDGKFGPGDEAQVPAADVARLVASGHVRPVDYEDPGVTQTGNLKVTPLDGPTVQQSLA